MDTERLHREIAERVEELALVITSEKNATVTGSSSRIAKGQYLDMLETLGNQLRTAEPTALSGLTPLQYARRRIAEHFENRGDFDTKLADQEVSMTRKVYRSLCVERGVSGEFTDHYHIHPQHHTPVTRDDGRHFEFPIASVALNNLYYVCDFAQYDLDKAVSMAKRASEKALAHVNRLFKHLRDNGRPEAIVEHLDALAALPFPSLETPEVMAYVDGQLGIVREPQEEEFRSVAVPKLDYDHNIRPALFVATQILGSAGRMVNEKTGMVNPQEILNPILSVYNPLEFGPWRLLDLLTSTGTITTVQAAAFAEMWANGEPKAQFEEAFGLDSTPAFEDIYPMEEYKDLAEELAANAEQIAEEEDALPWL